jgi:hypothetical protein
VQKEEEKAKERSGQPEVSMPEFMLYMNAVGSFLKPGLSRFLFVGHKV